MINKLLHVWVSFSFFFTSVKRQILQYQSCTQGLFPAIGSTKNPSREGYVRDSIYCAIASWSLSQAYRYSLCSLGFLLCFFIVCVCVFIQQREIEFRYPLLRNQNYQKFSLQSLDKVKI